MRKCEKREKGRNFSLIQIFSLILALFLMFHCSNKKGDNKAGLGLLALNSGGSSSSGGGYVPMDLGSMAIADAETLYIGKGTSFSSNNISANVNSQPTKLFKITSTGAVLEVTYKNKKGETITNVRTPSRIITMSDTYLFFDFGYGTNYLVNKTDNKTYEYSSPTKENNYRRFSGPIENSKSGYRYYGSSNSYEDYYLGSFIESDTKGNIYFAELNETFSRTVSSRTRHIIKLNVSNPSKIIRQSLLPQNHSLRVDGIDMIGFWGVDNDGNVAYVGSETHTKRKIHMRRSASASQVVAWSNRGASGNTNPIVNIWRGIDNNLYYCQAPATNNTETGIYRLNADGTSTAYGTTPSGVNKIKFCNDQDKRTNGAYNTNNQYAYLIKMKNAKRIIAISSSNLSSSKPNILEIYNGNTHTPRRITYSGISFSNININSSNSYGSPLLKFLGISDNYYYLQGRTSDDKDIVLKVNPVDDTYTKIIDDQYIVYKFSVDSKDNIVFQGLKKSDMTTTVLGKLAAGKVATDVNVKVLSSNTTKDEITVLKPIK